MILKTLLMKQYGELELVDTNIPECGEEEAIIQIKYAGICGTDSHIFNGDIPRAKPPLVMGHECCGFVHQIRSKRRNDLKVGDKVTMHAVEGCGICDNCRRGRENLCENVHIMGTEIDGFFREYIKVRADRVLKFRDDIDMQIAALTEPLTIGVHDVRRSGLQFGENVFISGCGTIGLMIAAVCRLSGASQIVISEMDDVRIETGKQFGFDVIDRKQADFMRICKEKTNGRLFDKVFEVSGVEAGFHDCLNMLKPGATMVQVGMPGKKFDGFDINKIIFNEINFLGVRNSVALSMSGAVKLVNDGVLDDFLRKMVSAVYKKEDSVDAFYRAKTDKKALKVLIDFNSDL